MTRTNIELDTGTEAQETGILRGQGMAIQTMNWDLVFDAWRHFTSDRSRATMYGACKAFCEKHSISYEAFTAERMSRRDAQESRVLRQDRNWIL